MDLAEETPLPLEQPKESILQTIQSAEERKPLTTKDAAKFLIEGNLKSRVCRYCLNVTSVLTEVDQLLQVANKGTFYKVTVKDMIASFHPFKVADDPNFPDKICEKCIDRVISSYLFTQQCEQAGRALHNCFDDILEKLNKLDPLDRPKKRGRQKLNPNFNIIHAEHKKVMDYADPIIHIVNTASEPMTAQDPINELECLKCCEILPNLESLLNHTNIHPKSMWYNCRLCGTSFPKIHQLKRHFRSKHQSKAPLETTGNTMKYECKTCGFVSIKYYDYLQHVETHKFKTVMEHLLAKKMDKLCAICFNKGREMVPLYGTICLHGGCPELTGNRSIYNVVASTLPEKKNKYQELFVPTQVNMIKIIRKMKNESQKATNFEMSNPVVLTADDLDCNYLYLFFFSEPYNILNSIESNEKQVEIKKNDKVTDIEKTSENVHFSKCENSCDTLLTAMEEEKTEIQEFSQNNELLGVMRDNSNDENETLLLKVKFTFSNPNFEIIKNKVKVNKFEEEESSKNLINPSYLEYSDKTKDVTISYEGEQNNIESINSRPCNYCWKFKHVDRCDYCKKSIDPLHTVVNSSDSSKTLIDTNALDITTKNIQNNSCTKDEDTVKDKKTWQCNVCLTDNKNNRENCYCCEDKPLLNVENNSFKSNQVIGNKFSLNKSNEVETAAMELNIPIDFKTTKVSQNTGIVISNNNNIKPEEISLMETEINESENTIHFSDPHTNVPHEAMDIEEIPEAIILDFPKPETNMSNTNFNEITSSGITNELPLTLNNNAFNTNQFQFAIGSAENAPRKYKKAVRKMPRAFHK